LASNIEDFAFEERFALEGITRTPIDEGMEYTIKEIEDPDIA
jgi:hypothetical protein